MVRDFRELISEDIRNNPEFAAGLYQDCIDLLQSDDAEDQAVGESMLAHYFDQDQARAAHQLAANAAETTKPATTTAD